MFFTHKDREGNLTPIYMLEDSHLVNIIKLAIRRMNALKSATEQGDAPQATGLIRAMYDVPEIDAQAAGELIREIAKGTTRYIAELFIRDLPQAKELRADLKAVLGREDALPVGLPELGAGHVTIDALLAGVLKQEGRAVHNIISDRDPFLPEEEYLRQ